MSIWNCFYIVSLVLNQTRIWLKQKALLFESHCNKFKGLRDKWDWMWNPAEGLELQPYPRRMQYARDTRRCGLFHKRLRATVWYANNANNANFNKQTLTHVENTNIAFNTKFKTKTTYSHYSGDRVLEGYISAIKNDVLKLKPTKPTHQNASQTQLKALTQLSNNSNIIIQKADKGSKSVF